MIIRSVDRYLAGAGEIAHVCALRLCPIHRLSPGLPFCVTDFPLFVMREKPFVFVLAFPTTRVFQQQWVLLLGHDAGCGASFKTCWYRSKRVSIRFPAEYVDCLPRVLHPLCGTGCASQLMRRQHGNARGGLS